MEIKVLDDNGEQVEEKQLDTTPDTIGSPSQIDEIAVAQVLELEGSQKAKYSNDINTLVEWAKSQTDDHDPINLKWVIRDLRMRIGSPALHEDPIRHLSRFAYLDLEGRRIKKEKDKYNVV